MFEQGIGVLQGLRPDQWLHGLRCGLWGRLWPLFGGFLLWLALGRTKDGAIELPVGPHDMLLDQPEEHPAWRAAFLAIQCHHAALGFDVQRLL